MIVVGQVIVCLMLKTISRFCFFYRFEMDEISLRKVLLDAGVVAFVPEYTG